MLRQLWLIGKLGLLPSIKYLQFMKITNPTSSLISSFVGTSSVLILVVVSTFEMLPAAHEITPCSRQS